jgi:hypothetical protein
MKSSSLFLIAALGVAAYFLFKPAPANGSNSGGDTGGGSSMLSPETWSNPAETKTYTVKAVTPMNQNIRQNISTVQEGINFINDNIAAGNQLQRTSTTLARQISYTDASGKPTTGNIATLANGNTVAISTNQPVRDSAGLTNFDRLIAANKKAALKK